MTVTQIELPAQILFSAKECLWFLNRGFDDCMYKVYPDKIRRAFQYNEELILTDIYISQQQLNIIWLTPEPSKQAINAIKTFIVNWFDLEQDLQIFYSKLAEKPALAYMPSLYQGLRLVGIPDLFEALAWAIIGQQINLTFAYKMKRRLVERYGTSISYQDELYYLFPSTQTIASAEIHDLLNMQFSRKKAEYLITVAQAITSGALSKKILLEQPDFPSRIKFLTNLRGIGIWTANYVLMKSLKEPSCIPHGDSGLLKALINHRILKDKTDTRTINELFGEFKGWESYLVFYLWRSLT